MEGQKNRLTDLIFCVCRKHNEVLLTLIVDPLSLNVLRYGGPYGSFLTQM